MKIITQPTVEPVTLAEVKEQLGITTTDTESDAVITRRITEARVWAEGYLSRTLMPTTLELRFDSFPCEIELRAPPVASVSSVKYVDGNGTVQTVSPSDYELDNFPLLPYIRAAYGKSWPSPRGERNAVRVQYVAGYPVTALDAAQSITSISKAAPGIVGKVAHGYSDGDLLLLDVAGMTELDGGLYRVRSKTTDTFQLANLANNAGISTADFTTFTSGTMQKVHTSVPAIVRDAMILIIGHWTNYQNRLEGEGFITRVPLAIQQMLDSEKIWTV